MWNPFRKRGKVEIVRPSDGVAAKQRLQRHARFDIDAFLARETAEKIFDEPLGSTPQCLSITQIGDLVEGKAISAEAYHHAVMCGECAKEILNYRALTEHDWETESKFVVAFAHAIRIPAGGNFFLVLGNQGQSGLLSGIDPSSVVVGGAIEASGCRIAPHASPLQGVSEAVELHFLRYRVNAPAGQNEVCNWLELEARTKTGKLRKRQLVRILQEAHV